MSLDGATDAQLIACCRAGEEAAWSELVERCSRYVYAILVRGFRLEPADAEDVFQEVFTRAYTHLASLRDDAAFMPWLAQLARRLAIDRLRALGRETPEADPRDEGGLDDRLARLDEALTVRAALAVLSSDCQEILDRFFARDESYQTISAALDLPLGTIASRISRCLAKLRTELEGRSVTAAASS